MSKQTMFASALAGLILICVTARPEMVAQTSSASSDDNLFRESRPRPRPVGEAVIQSNAGSIRATSRARRTFVEQNVDEPLEVGVWPHWKNDTIRTRTLASDYNAVEASELRPVTVAQPYTQYITSGRGSEDQKLRAQTEKLQAQLHHAKDSQDEASIIEQLTKVLDDHFELRMKQREKRLDELEERLTNLRDQIRKRRLAKEEIIELRLKTLANEAKGLGF